jgi:hypothetical protein
MREGPTMKNATIGITAVAALMLLTACSDPEPTGITLADTKSYAQLQRNTISGQISPDITESITRVTDASESCDGDESREMRLWRSTALTELTPEAAGEITRILQSISGAYVSEGWTSDSEAVSRDTTVVTLVNPGSLAIIELTAVTNEDGIGMGANLFVNIAGPCVKTDGPGSAELAELGE